MGRTGGLTCAGDGAADGLGGVLGFVCADVAGNGGVVDGGVATGGTTTGGVCTATGAGGCGRRC